ncbi:hypothetical protein E2C01_086269 [Portunus trituberculatus]|uniref:Uncharacterized protein n=1 Tax=Portunus trituberculatus TaxID=210409 RepID=A0A5B7J979_PORTR|nr:hypothetical protein [Portunus trituberculatus]
MHHPDRGSAPMTPGNRTIKVSNEGRRSYYRVRSKSYRGTEARRNTSPLPAPRLPPTKDSCIFLASNHPEGGSTNHQADRSFSSTC